MVKNASPSLTQFDNKPLRDRIADVLRGSIIRGEFKPGDVIVEMELAAQLGVSRAPLREALQKLNTEGLIEIIPYNKTMVRKLTRQDITELYSLRSTLETFATRLIIERGDPAAAHSLRDICDQMVECAKTGDRAQTSAIDHQFHDTVVALSQHNLLISTWNTVSQRVHQVLALRRMTGSNILEMATSHYVLVEALEAGELAQTARLFEEHIMNARELIVEVWDDSS